jgi:hypothetical protein
MIIGDPASFAIESGISIAYEELGAVALGFFVIHIGGRCYGVHEPDATWLACSFNEVEERISRRGSHTAPFAVEPDAGKIADAYRDAVFAADQETNIFFGISQLEFSSRFHSQKFVWAPDGDEAFDDGSYALQFDVGDRVRLIGFKSDPGGYHHNPATLRDVWLETDKFYGILQSWRDAFKSEWMAAPKLFKAHGPDELQEQHLAEIIRLSQLTKTIRSAKNNIET